MATLNVIRRWALRDQMSIREISRRTGLARNTMKKHLRSEESEPIPKAGQLKQARPLRREAGSHHTPRNSEGFKGAVQPSRDGSIKLLMPLADERPKTASVRHVKYVDVDRHLLTTP